jgi:Ca2+-binding RTX toxin-like protein
MGALNATQTIWAQSLQPLGQSTILTTRTGAAPQLILDDPVSGTRTVLDIGAGDLDLAAADTGDLSPRGTTYSVTLNGRSGTLPEQVFAAIGDSTHAFLDGIGFAGNLVQMHSLTVTGQDWMVMSQVHGNGLASYRIGSGGAPDLVTVLRDNDALMLSGIAAIDSAWVDGTPYIVTASTHESGISVMQMGTSGQLWHRDQFGAEGKLPIDRPVALETVQMDGRHFIVTADFGSGSLTVLELHAGGTLSFVDQVNDTRDTRFGNTSVLDTITVDGRVFIAAGGSDGGVSLFQMLPGGYMLHSDTLIDGLDTALDGLSGLRFVQNGSALELFALSTRDTGLTRIAVDMGPSGVAGAVSQGTAGNDVIAPASGRSDVRGEAGDDILMDGTGSETLWGGDGADMFVFVKDGQTDTIADFDVTEDRIDISRAGRIYDITNISMTNILGGMVLIWGDEELILQAAYRTKITARDIEGVMSFETDHVIMPENVPLRGTSGNDTFVWSQGADTIDGGAGTDRVDYSIAPEAVRVDLRDPSGAANAMAAEGDILRNIEGIIGTRYADVIRGDDSANTLVGGVGDDTINGGGGADWIMPGSGRGQITGGAGTDMLALSDLAAGARVSLAAGTLTIAGQTSSVTEFESITGSIFADVIEGDSRDNRLRGLGDYDWFIGTGGSDSYDGGNGRDMVSYVYAPSGVTLNLATGSGTRGLAAGDTYTSIERVTGSIHADIIWGGTGEEDIRGLGGYDWFIGSPGSDRFDGGSGVDMVAYWTSITGVVANLAQGRGVGGDAARDLYTSIEGLTGSGHADDLTGDNGRNVLRGLGGNDTLDGYGGVDRLEGGRGDDIINGGWGWDLAVFSGDRSEYIIDRRAGGALTVTDTVLSRDGTDLLTNVEALAFDDGWFYF